MVGVAGEEGAPWISPTARRSNALRTQMSDFMDRYVYPNEQTYREQIAASGNPFHHAEIVDELKAKAQGRRALEPLPAR